VDCTSEARPDRLSSLSGLFTALELLKPLHLVLEKGGEHMHYIASLAPTKLHYRIASVTCRPAGLVYSAAASGQSIIVPAALHLHGGGQAHWQSQKLDRGTVKEFKP
jgi:hypothetical protein